MGRSIRTFILPKLIERLEASGVVDIIRFECDAEEVPVGVDRFFLVIFFSPTEPVHLPILQFDVEVGKLHVVALCVIHTPEKDD